MRLKSLTYTSLARAELSTAEVGAIYQTARHLNVLDGVTGVLVYNGRNFLQVIEGAESAIDDLMRRLLADPRHSALTVEDERFIEPREFPQWAMEFIRVNVDPPEARPDILDRLPPSLPESVRARISMLIAGEQL